MPISPNVAAYMNESQDARETADQIFNRNFGSRAFDGLRAKFPELLELVVSFRVLSSDIKESNALGCFIVQSGNEERYIPVVMSSGSLEPCEMMYNRVEDCFVPLLPEFVKEFISSGKLADPRVVKGNIKIDDTREMFRRLVKPPLSSSVTLAASSSPLSGLPDKAKRIVRDHFRNNPDMLGRISTFYPVEKLAEDLAVRAQETPQVTRPTAIRLCDAKPAQVSWMSDSQKSEMLKLGYTVVNAVDSPAVTAMPHTEHPLEGLEEYEYHSECWCDSSGERGKAPELFTAMAFQLGAEGIEAIPVLVMGYMAFTRGGKCSCNFDKLLIRRDNVPVTDSVLREYGAQTIEELLRNTTAEWAVPVLRTRRGSHVCGEPDLKLYLYPGSAPERPKLVEESSCRIIQPAQSYRSSVTLVSSLKYGWLKDRQEGYMLPEGTLWMPVNQTKTLHGLRGFDDFWKAMKMMASPLLVLREGNTVSITDQKLDKTARFQDEAAAAEHLARTYGLGQQGIRTVLDSKKSYVMDKRANYGEVMAQRGADGTLKFNPEALTDFAMLGDDHEFDLGVLTSFGDDPDANTLLLDYLPDFERLVDKMGRTILLLTLRRKDMAAYYSDSGLSDLLASCRKIFTLVGGIALRLRGYIRMA